MLSPFFVGIAGSIILIVGAILPDRPVSHPAKSAVNWLFLVGSACMFLYSYLNFLDGGSIFFIFLQILIAVSTVLMMLNTPDRFDVVILSLAGGGLILWSLTLFEGYGTILFIAGLSLLGIGFALKTGTSSRNTALAVGSAIVAVFSYLQADWIFFWLNVFFAILSAWDAVKLRGKPVS